MILRDAVFHELTRGRGELLGALLTAPLREVAAVMIANTVSPVKTAEIASSGAVGPSPGGSHGRRTAARLRAIGSPTAVAWATDRG